MSWLSSVGNFLGNAAKKVGSVVKSVATPLASFAVGLVPGVGSLLSKGVDVIGNKLLGDDTTSTQSATPVSDLLASMNGAPTLQLGSSPAAQAMAVANTTGAGFLGIGDGKPGILGIGDGKPGIFGIGTGAGAAKKAAAAAAAEGYTPGVSTKEYTPSKTSSEANGGMIAAGIGILAALLLA